MVTLVVCWIVEFPAVEAAVTVTVNVELPLSGGVFGGVELPPPAPPQAVCKSARNNAAPIHA